MSRRLTCFAILPSNWEGKPTQLASDDRWGLASIPSSIEGPTGATKVDFDHVYEHIIDAAASKAAQSQKDLTVVCERGVDIAESGSILQQVTRRICQADVVIVDVTSCNPNVFLEYGLRLSTRPSGNILICHKECQKHLPFNIRDSRVIPYSLDLADAREAINQLSKFLIASLDGPKETSGYFSWVEEFSGRSSSKMLAGLAFEASDLMLRLRSAQVDGSTEEISADKDVFEYLMKFERALERDPEAAEDVLKAIINNPFFWRGRRAQACYQMALLCGSNPDRTEESARYRNTAKSLEND